MNFNEVLLFCIFLSLIYQYIVDQICIIKRFENKCRLSDPYMLILSFIIWKYTKDSCFHITNPPKVLMNPFLTCLYRLRMTSKQFPTHPYIFSIPFCAHITTHHHVSYVFTMYLSLPLRLLTFSRHCYSFVLHTIVIWATLKSLSHVYSSWAHNFRRHDGCRSQLIATIKLTMIPCNWHVPNQRCLQPLVKIAWEGATSDRLVNGLKTCLWQATRHRAKIKYHIERRINKVSQVVYV